MIPMVGIGFFPPNDAADVLPPANNSELIEELEDDERVTGEKCSVRLREEGALKHPNAFAYDKIGCCFDQQLGLYDDYPSLPAIGQTVKMQSKASSWENCYAKVW